MSDQQLKIICGNPKCKAGILIRNPQKYKEAKCPACGYINPVHIPLPMVEAKSVAGSQPVSEKPPLPAVLGWLMVVGSSGSSQTHALKLGSNTIGRKSAASPSDHMISTDDEQMSRRHCTIEVKISKLGMIECILRDGAILPDGSWKMSGNGTFYNDRRNRLSEYDSIYLEEGDAFRIGTTKLFVKKNHLSEALQRAYCQTEEMDFERTIIGMKVS